MHLEIMHSVIDQIPWSVEKGDGSLGITGINLVRAQGRAKAQEALEVGLL